MKVLVVGGAGYLGGAVTDRLLKTKHEFRVFDGLFYEESFRKPVDFFYGDIRDHSKLLPHLKWADCTIWLAALVGDGACALNPDISTEINDKSVAWLAKHFDGRIIFTSTCSVYGAQHEKLDEDSPTNPLSVYASTKLAAENHLKNKDAIIFRLGTLFGISDTYSRIRMDLVINYITARAFMNETLKIFGGEQYRPVLHVFDTAQAIVDNISTSHTGIYNLRRDNIKISQLPDHLIKYFPDLKVQTVPMTFQDARNYSVKIDKAIKDLSFKPTKTIDDGIIEIKKLLTQHRIRDIDNPRYTNQMYLSMFNSHIKPLYEI